LPGAKRSAMYGTPRLAIASSRSAWRCPLVLEKIEAELSNERLQAAEKQHLRRRAELIRSPLRLGPITWPVAMRSAVHQNRRSNGFFILRDARRWNGRKSRSTSHYAATLRQGKRVADGTTTAGVLCSAATRRTDRREVDQIGACPLRHSGCFLCLPIRARRTNGVRQAGPRINQEARQRSDGTRQVAPLES
jgi:hypothetical protein